jgi:hypothetical protein
MIITKTEHIQRMYAKTFDAGFKEKTHIETHLITTYWFLFLPVFKTKQLQSHNL